MKLKKSNWTFVLMILAVLLFLSACTPEGEISPILQGPLSVFIQGLVELLIIPLLLMLVAWVFGQVKALWHKLSLRHPDETYWIEFVIQNVVMAAEQMADAYPDEISNKRDWAIDQAKQWFAQIGLKIELEQIATMIEAEVRTLFHTEA